MNERRNSATILFLAMVLVAGAHYWAARVPTRFFSSDFERTKKNDEAPIEVEKWVEPDERSVVQSSRIEEDPEAADEKARHLGGNRNRVKKETQSEFRGRYRQGGPASGIEEQDEFGEAPHGTAHLNLKDLMPFSTSPNALSDEIARGNDTVLNTDPILYAAFLNRIADAIYDSWDRFAREAVMSYPGRNQLGANTYVTKLGVILNEVGDVTEIRLIQSSGIDQLDNAPKKAFWATKGFPNPPKQILKEDGLIRLTYEFHFELRNASFSIVPLTI